VDEPAIAVLPFPLTNTLVTSRNPSTNINPTATTHFNLFVLPALIAAASAQPTEAPKTNGLFARDEYRWCLGA
jgi:hypothetical protein